MKKFYLSQPQLELFYRFAFFTLGSENKARELVAKSTADTCPEEERVMKKLVDLAMRSENELCREAFCDLDIAPTVVELLCALPQKERCVVVLRYCLGFTARRALLLSGLEREDFYGCLSRAKEVFLVKMATA